MQDTCARDHIDRVDDQIVLVGLIIPNHNLILVTLTINDKDLGRLITANTIDTQDQTDKETVKRHLDYMQERGDRREKERDRERKG